MESLIRQKIDLIAECIFAKIQQPEKESYGLYSGEFGLLLFFFYYSKYSQNKKYVMLTERYAKRLSEQFIQGTKLQSFYSGFSGILYLFDFLRENDFIDIDVSNNQPALDNYLISQMRQDIQQQYYDFMHGALGIGLYFLKQRTNTKWIHELIKSLYQTAEKDSEDQSFKWKTIISHEHNLIGYNPSLSHGISSIIIFLSRVVNSGKRDVIIMEMLSGAVNYVLSLQKDFTQFGSYFPHYLITNHQVPVSKSRLAWCYGDLGIGLALWQAGKAIDNKGWKDKGLEILLQSTKRKNLSDNFVIDAEICHGSAGIALIFRRMYLETTMNQFKEATDFWIKQTLSFSEYEDGLVGFKTYMMGEWIGDYSLVTGISGIGLVLMSYIADDLQNWDEMLLLS